MVAPNNPPAAPAERTLVLARMFDAPRELVFKAWSAPEHLANWFGPTNFTLPFCEVDFRVGGNYRLCMRSPEGKEYWVHGTYREILEPQRLVFTWERDGPDDEHAGHTLVTITLEDVAGKTRLTLHQAIFGSADIRDGHGQGWTEAFGRLDQYLERA